MYSVCLRGFSPDTAASSHSPRQAISGVSLTGNSKLSIGVHVGLDSYLSFCVSVSKALPALQQLGQGSVPPQTPH